MHRLYRESIFIIIPAVMFAHNYWMLGLIATFISALAYRFRGQNIVALNFDGKLYLRASLFLALGVAVGLLENTKDDYKIAVVFLSLPILWYVIRPVEKHIKSLKS